MAVQRDQTIEMIRANDVRDDPSWVVDGEVVEGFRNTIRSGVTLLPVKTRPIWHEDGSYHLDLPIDGIHRHRAYVAEGVEEYPAIVVEMDDREAELQRIQASANKTDEVLHKRALVAVRQLFVRDLLSVLQGATIYEPVIDEEGRVQAIPHHGPLPEDPLMALGVLYDHLQARSTPDLDWEQVVTRWLKEVSARFNRTPEWLRDEVLGITALVNDGVPGKNSAERARLLAGIPDVSIRRAVLGKLKRESKLTDTRLRFALDWLGCGPDCGTLPWLPKLGRAQMQSRLAHNTLDALTNLYLQAAEAAREAERRRAEQARTAQPAREPEPPAANMDKDEPEHAQPFAVVRAAAIGVPTTSKPATVSASQPSWDLPHASITDTLRWLERYDQQGGDWTHDDVRRDLEMLVERAQGYLGRGG